MSIEHQVFEQTEAFDAKQYSEKFAALQKKFANREEKYKGIGGKNFIDDLAYTAEVYRDMLDAGRVSINDITELDSVLQSIAAADEQITAASTDTKVPNALDRHSNYYKPLAEISNSISRTLLVNMVNKYNAVADAGHKFVELSFGDQFTTAMEADKFLSLVQLIAKHQLLN